MTTSIRNKYKAINEKNNDGPKQMDQQPDKQLDRWKYGQTDKRNSTAFMIKLVAVPIASIGQKNILKPSQSLNIKIH